MIDADGKPGRPRKFPNLECPACDAGTTLFCTGTHKAGHVINSWLRCSVCGTSFRFVQAGAHGRLVRVRTPEELMRRQEELEQERCKKRRAGWLPLLPDWAIKFFRRKRRPSS